MRRPKKSPPVGVLTKTFQIIDLIGSSPSSLTLHEISGQTGINKSTALRFLAHLEAAHYLNRDVKGGYSIGPRLLQLASGKNAQSHLREAARQSLWRVWRSTEETVNLAVLEGFEVVYVDCLESAHDLRMVTNIGMRAEFYRTALGKAIVALLPEARRQLLLRSSHFHAFTPRTLQTPEALEKEFARIRRLGYAVDEEESVTGLRCVGVPVLDEDGHPLAAISVSGPTSRVTPDKVKEFARELQEAAREISTQVTSWRASLSPASS